MTTFEALIDDRGRILGLPHQTIQTLIKDGGGADETNVQNWKVITPTVDSTGAYYSNNTAGTATISAGVSMLVHPDLRLGIDTLCWCG